MNFNNYDVKLGSWYQGLVQYVMERKVYHIYHQSYGTNYMLILNCEIVLTAFMKRVKSWTGPSCNCGICAEC